MDQLKKPQVPKTEIKAPVPSDFWYIFDFKSFRIKPRNVWSFNRKAPRSAEPMRPMRGPVSFVYLAFTLDPSGKTNVARYHSSRLGPRPKTLQVMKALQDMQALEFKLHRPEIRFNFMIGGDGVVYEGRGWNYCPALPRKYWYDIDDSIYIGFIGNWEKIPPPKHLINLKDEVIKLGIERKVISKQHCQITISYSCQYKNELIKYLS